MHADKITMKKPSSFSIGIVFVASLLGIANRVCDGENGSANGKRAAAVVRETEDPSEEGRRHLSVRVVDTNGKTVADAFVAHGEGRFDDRDPYWELNGVIAPGEPRATTTDATGTAQVSGNLLSDGGVILVARHPKRRLVGLRRLSHDQLLSMSKEQTIIEIQLQPECRVHGKVRSTGLKKLGQHLRWILAIVDFDGRPVYSFKSSHLDFEFYLPPGEYKFDVGGSYALPVGTNFTVSAGQPDLELATIDLPPTDMARLVGKTAREIADVAAWKNCKPLKLADLKGKYVLLDFWGHWCPGCVKQMPRLMALHDSFSKQGLVIIGVHVGLEDEIIDSVEKLDAKLDRLRKDFWAGRDIPFPVAMVNTRQIELPGIERPFRCQAAVDYCVQGYPSRVLIDPKGKVIGWYDEEEHAKLFENLPKTD